MTWSKSIDVETLKPLNPIPTEVERSGSLRTRLKGILFDVYGTLFISASGDISLAQGDARNTEKLLNLLERYHVDLPIEELLERFYAAIRAAHTARRKEGIDFPEVEIDRIWMQVLELDSIHRARKFAVEFEFLVNPVYPMPNLKLLIEGCLKKGLILGIVSNAQFFTPFLFELFLGSSPDHLGFSPDLLFYSYQFGYAKPSRFLYEKAVAGLERFGIFPDSVLYVGNDMLNDIYPAQAVGLKTALFAGDARSLRLRPEDDRCLNLKPDLVVTDLIQLLDYL